MRAVRTMEDPGVERLLAVTRSITGELDLERLLRSILVSAVEVTGAERGCLMVMLCPEEGFLDHVLYHRLDPAEMDSESFRPSRSAMDCVLETREGLRLSDALNAPNPSQSVEALRLRSILCEPFVLRERLIGLLYLDSSKVTNLFTPRHQELLRSFAAQAAICIENARLFSQVEEATRCRMEEEMRARDMEARRDMMSAFVSTAAHDIRNPLSVLRTGVYVLGKLGLPDPGPEVLEAMDQSIGQATRLVQNYLEFSRLDANETIPLNLEALALEPLVQRELEFLRARLSQEVLQRFRFEADVPGDLVLRADTSRVQQVLANLLDNATNYSPQGGLIQVWARPGQRGGVILEVRDQGVGIRPEEKDQLFERFSRLPGMATKTKGTGLGLWITRRLVELHGWAIEVDSEVGRGSTFRILAEP